MSRLAPSLLSGAAFLAALATPPLVLAADPGPTRVGVDEKKQVSFSMTGRAVTVSLRPVDGQPNPLGRDLDGTKVVLACQGRGPKDGRKRIVDDEARWPTGAQQHRFLLAKDVSKKPKWCVLERPQGTDLAVTFTLRVVKTDGGTDAPAGGEGPSGSLTPGA